MTVSVRNLRIEAEVYTKVARKDYLGHNASLVRCFVPFFQGSSLVEGDVFRRLKIYRLVQKRVDSSLMKSSTDGMEYDNVCQRRSLSNRSTLSHIESSFEIGLKDTSADRRSHSRTTEQCEACQVRSAQSTSLTGHLSGCKIVF